MVLAESTRSLRANLRPALSAAKQWAVVGVVSQTLLQLASPTSPSWSPNPSAAYQPTSPLVAASNALDCVCSPTFPRTASCGKSWVAKYTNFHNLVSDYPPARASGLARLVVVGYARVGRATTRVRLDRDVVRARPWKLCRYTVRCG